MTIRSIEICYANIENYVYSLRRLLRSSMNCKRCECITSGHFEYHLDYCPEHHLDRWPEQYLDH